MDTSENEDDDNFVCRSRAEGVTVAQTRGSSRPARSAATKASKSLASRKQGTDYHHQPELLYEQQVFRYEIRCLIMYVLLYVIMVDDIF